MSHLVSLREYTSPSSAWTNTHAEYTQAALPGLLALPSTLTAVLELSVYGRGLASFSTSVPVEPTCVYE